MVKIDENIWLINGENVDFYGFPYPTRSVIIRLQNRDLWVWSPIRLTEEIKDFINQTGPVKHLISPNKIHHLYLGDWKKNYPNALLWGPHSTIKKRVDLDFETALNDIAPSHWSQEIDQFWLNGSFIMDEVVFFHKSSKTAIFADLSENFSEKKQLHP